MLLKLDGCALGPILIFIFINDLDDSLFSNILKLADDTENVQCGQKRFNTPIVMLGSDFQKSVWHELIKIPPGETRSYTDIAKRIKQPSACRAVARANGANQLAVIIPCHRVINSDGELGGYGGGLTRKAWLINHEKV